jgi:hypothetical protein
MERGESREQRDDAEDNQEGEACRDEFERQPSAV